MNGVHDEEVHVGMGLLKRYLNVSGEQFKVFSFLSGFKKVPIDRVTNL